MVQEEKPQQGGPEAHANRSRWRLWGWLEPLGIGLLALILNLAGNSRTGLWDRDEPRYAVCVREMRASGNWVFPTFNGEPRYHKPILIYWLMGLGTALAGDNPFGVRLVSAVAGVGTVLGVWALGSRMLGPRGAAGRARPGDGTDRGGRIEAGNDRRDARASAPWLPGLPLDSGTAAVPCRGRPVLGFVGPRDLDQRTDCPGDDRRGVALGVVVGLAAGDVEAAPLAARIGGLCDIDRTLVHRHDDCLGRRVSPLCHRQADRPPSLVRHGGARRLSRLLSRRLNPRLLSLVSAPADGTGRSLAAPSVQSQLRLSLGLGGRPPPALGVLPHQAHSLLPAGVSRVCAAARLAGPLRDRGGCEHQAQGLRSTGNGSLGRDRSGGRGPAGGRGHDRGRASAACRCWWSRPS